MPGERHTATLGEATRVKSGQVTALRPNCPAEHSRSSGSGSNLLPQSPHAPPHTTGCSHSYIPALPKLSASSCPLSFVHVVPSAGNALPPTTGAGAHTRTHTLLNIFSW